MVARKFSGLRTRIRSTLRRRLHLVRGRLDWTTEDVGDVPWGSASLAGARSASPQAKKIRSSAAALRYQPLETITALSSCPIGGHDNRVKTSDPTSTDTSVDRYIDGLPIRPITLRNGEMLNHDALLDPNVIIFDYLKRSAGSTRSN